MCRQLTPSHSQSIYFGGARQRARLLAAVMDDTEEYDSHDDEDVIITDPISTTSRLATADDVHPHVDEDGDEVRREVGSQALQTRDTSGTSREPSSATASEMSALPRSSSTTLTTTSTSTCTTSTTTTTLAKPSPSRSKRRKVVDVDSDSDSDSEGSSCTICMERWTNSGAHCISSLKCGHFFGQSCINRWLKSTNWCPICKSKALKKDVRNHFVTRLKALDTAEQERAIKDLERAQKSLREAELKNTTLALKVRMQQKEIEEMQFKLKRQGSQQETVNLDFNSGMKSQLQSKKWTYSRRLEICKKTSMSPDSSTEQVGCRVMAYDPSNALLCVSQPSFTALAPGHGVRRVSLLEQKTGAFVPLHREAVRDLCFHPFRTELLLSASQDKSVRVTNVQSSQEVNRYILEEEAWSCCWNLENPHQFFVGTKRSQILLYDTREDSSSYILNGSSIQPKCQLCFPTMERRPIIGLVYVPKSNESSNEQPFGGLVVQTLGSLWFFEHLATSDTYKAHKIDVDGPFWALKFDVGSRLLLVSTKPNPCAKHVICELRRVNINETSSDAQEEDFRVVANALFTLNSSSSYLGRSFVRSLICAYPDDKDRVMIVYARGSAANDQRVVIQQLGCNQVGQTITINAPILDIWCAFNVGNSPILAVLTELHLTLYNWQ